MRKILFSFIILLFLFSCGKKIEKNHISETNNEVKVYNNSATPSDPDLKVELKELFTITATDKNNDDSLRTIFDLSVVDIDKQNNIYILSTRKSAIKKFDSSGKFIKSFGSRGTGPGESQLSWNMTVINDTILFDDYEGKKMVKYDTNGNFLRNLTLNFSGPPERFLSRNDSTIIGFQAYYEGDEENYFISYNPTIWNSKFEKVHELYEMKIKYDESKYNFADMLLSAYAVSENEIFYAIISQNKYQINAYDMDGRHKHIIKKNYIRTTFNEKELEKYSDYFKQADVFSKNKSQYKRAINQIEYDKQGRLWVFSSIQRDEKNLTDLNIDIFKDGVFLNTIKLDICPSYDYYNFEYQIILRNDRLYLINRVDTSLTVYDYD